MGTVRAVLWQPWAPRMSRESEFAETLRAQEPSTFKTLTVAQLELYLPLRWSHLSADQRLCFERAADKVLACVWLS